MLWNSMEQSCDRQGRISKQPHKMDSRRNETNRLFNHIWRNARRNNKKIHRIIWKTADITRMGSWILAMQIKVQDTRRITKRSKRIQKKRVTDIGNSDRFLSLAHARRMEI